MCIVYPKTWRIYKPTSSYNSAPGKPSIAMSKSGFLFFFIQTSMLLTLLLYYWDFLECMMVLIFSPLMFSTVFLYIKAFNNSSFKTEGWNSSISNCIKVHLFFLFIFLNQFNIALVSCHWFKDDKSLTLLLRCFRKKLLIYQFRFSQGWLNSTLDLNWNFFYDK